MWRQLGDASRAIPDFKFHVNTFGRRVPIDPDALCAALRPIRPVD
jgi:hypothetical protein